MANLTPTPRFKKGNTLAKDNNNVRKHRIRKSPLRKTEAQLKAIEPQAMQNIADSVNGVAVDKEKVMTSKWVVNTIISLRKAVTADEVDVTNLLLTMHQAEIEEEAEKEEAEATPVNRFSLHILPTSKDV